MPKSGGNVKIKLKTKSGAKKRFKVSAGGKIVCRAAFRGHNFSTATANTKRQRRGAKVISAADTPALARVLHGS